MKFKIKGVLRICIDGEIELIEDNDSDNSNQDTNIQCNNCTPQSSGDFQQSGGGQDFPAIGSQILDSITDEGYQEVITEDNQTIITE